MKRLFYLLAACAAFLSGCEEVPDDPGAVLVYKEYLIDAYIAPERLEVRPNGRMYMTGPQYTSGSTGADLETFLQLAALHGGRIDREIWINMHVYVACGCVLTSYFDDLVSIDITCDQPWDETHPAGSSLNEFAYVSFHTFAPFVRRGNTGREIEEEVIPLDQIKDGDLDMIAHGTLDMHLYHKGIYSEQDVFTITLTTRSGRTLSAKWVR